MTPVSEEVREDASSAAEAGEMEENPDFRWKNRFSGVSQFKPQSEEPPASAGGTSDTYFSTYSESEISKYQADTLSASSPAPEERVITSPAHLRHDSEEAAGRRGLPEWEEPGAPAALQREGGEPERTESRWETQQLPTATLKEEEEVEEAVNEDDRFTGVFKATWVELDPGADPALPPSTPPASPDADDSPHFEMESLVDTLKNMGPSGLRTRSTGSLRSLPPNLGSSLPPIVEDAASPVTQGLPEVGKSPARPEGNSTAEAPNGFYALPPELGLRGTPRDTRSPLELMKQGQKVPVKQFYC